MKEQKKIKIIIVILAILLAISTAALTGTLLYNHFARNEPASVVVPGNIITPDSEDSTDSDETTPPDSTTEPDTTVTTDSTTPSDSTDTDTSAPSTDSKPDETTSVSVTKASAISLHNRKPEDNTPFQVTNMFPGDVETKYYRIKVSYKGDIIVRYHADIRPGYEKLSEVLKVRI